MRPETGISRLKTDTTEDIMFLHCPCTRNLQGPNIILTCIIITKAFGQNRDDAIDRL
jgi:hypothetical protein